MQQERVDRRRLALDGAVGVAGGVAAVAGSYAAVGFRPAFVVAPISTLVTELTPDAVLTWAILTLGSLGQSLALVTSVAVTVVGFGALVVGVRRLGADSGRLVVAAATTALVAVAALALSGSPLSGLGAGVGAGIVSLAGVVGVPVGGSDTDADRRGFLRTLLATVAVGGVGVLAGSRRADQSAVSGSAPSAAATQGEPGGGSVVAGLLDDATARSLDVPDLEPLVSTSFFRVDINNVDPDLSADEWSLRLTGAVDEERTFDFADVTSLPAEHRFVTLQCVGDALNGRKIDTALWTGIPLEALLPDLPDECCVMLRAADDYYEEFPMRALRNGFLAYRMNGEPLPRAHGHPLRALIPGHWGEINVKWLTEIEVLEEPADGYWEQRGWHGTGPVNTVAKLHSTSKRDDGRVVVGGHAYAGTRGIRRVEVSTDGGETWAEAELSEPLPGAVDAGTGESLREEAEDAWRMWRHAYDATDTHEVVVRAVDGTGALQSSEEQRAFPSGPTGWVSQQVNPGRL